MQAVNTSWSKWSCIFYTTWVHPIDLQWPWMGPSERTPEKKNPQTCKHNSARSLSLKQLSKTKADATVQLILLCIVMKWREDIMMKKSSCDVFRNVTKVTTLLTKYWWNCRILYSCFTKGPSSVPGTHLVHNYHPSKSWPYPTSRQHEVCGGVGRNRVLASQSYLEKEGTLTPFTFICGMIYVKNTLDLCLNLNHPTQHANRRSSAVRTDFSPLFTCILRNISSLWWLCCVQQHWFPGDFCGALKRGTSR